MKKANKLHMHNVVEFLNSLGFVITRFYTPDKMPNAYHKQNVNFTFDFTDACGILRKGYFNDNSFCIGSKFYNEKWVAYVDKKLNKPKQTIKEFEPEK